MRLIVNFKEIYKRKYSGKDLRQTFMVSALVYIVKLKLKDSV